MKTNHFNPIVLAVAVMLFFPLVTEAVSKVAFDNQSGRPALVKLAGSASTSISVENGKTESVYVPPGHYYIKIRYGIPGAYSYSKGDEFDVKETATTTSDITITLHKVVAGNYGSKSISEAEFGADERTDKQAGQAADKQAGQATDKQAGQTEWATLGWSKTIIEKVEELAKNQYVDPVSTYLGFTEISKYVGANAPTSAQKKWLEAVAAETKPRAIELLRQDFKQAADADDLRGCINSLAVANMVETNMPEDMAGVLARIKSRVVSGKLGQEFQPIWKVEDAVGKYLPGYSEGGGFVDRFSLTPKPGFSLLSVNVHIENVSATSDPPYISFTLPQLIRDVGRGFNVMTAKPGKPSRLAHDQFAFLLTPGGDWIPCGHVSESSRAIRGISFTDRVYNKMLFSGSYLEQNKDFYADFIFSVPEGIKDFRFLFLGSTPVAVKIAND